MSENSVTIKVEGPTKSRTRTLELEEEYNFFDEIYIKVHDINYTENELDINDANGDATFEIYDVNREICSEKKISYFSTIDFTLDHTIDFHQTDVSMTYIGTNKAEINYNSNKKTLSIGEYCTADNIQVYLESIDYDDNIVNRRVSLKICQPGEGSAEEVSLTATEEAQEQVEKIYRATTEEKEETPPMPEPRRGLLASFFNWLFSLF